MWIQTVTPLNMDTPLGIGYEPITPFNRVTPLSVDTTLIHLLTGIHH